MKIVIRAKNIQLTQDLSALIEEKMEGLKKFVNVLKSDDSNVNGKTLAELFFEIEKETKHHKKGEVFKAEGMILLPGKKLIARAKGDDLIKTVIEVKDELQQELKKYKSKPLEKRRREQRKAKRQNI